MYGAARLERANIDEYVRAAELAAEAGRSEWVEDLLAMAEVEWEHEAWFRSKAEAHPLWKWAPKWAPPAPIRRPARVL